MIYISNKKKGFLALLDIICKPLFVSTIIKNRLSKTNSADLNPKKILIIEIWGIGDVVLIIPALRALKSKFPNAEITLLAKAHAQEILKGSSLVDKFMTFNFPWTGFRKKYSFRRWDFKGLWSLIRQLRKNSFDLALDARADVRNNFLMYLSGASKRAGYTYTGGGHFLTDIVPVDYTKQHRIDEWARLLEYIGIPVKDFTPQIRISEQEEIWANEFLALHNIAPQDLTVGIHPGGAIRKRCWPLDRFAEVAGYIQENYNAKIIVFVEPNGFGENIPISGEWVKAKIRLRRLICILSKLDLLICNDSGPMHLAAAVNTALIAIFGPGSLEVVGPWGKKQSIVRKENIACRPCRDYCKYDQPFCLTEISVDQVLREADSKIAGMVSQNR